MQCVAGAYRVVQLSGTIATAISTSSSVTVATGFASHVRTSHAGSFVTSPPPSVALRVAETSSGDGSGDGAAHVPAAHVSYALPTGQCNADAQATQPVSPERGCMRPARHATHAVCQPAEACANPRGQATQVPCSLLLTPPASTDRNFPAAHGFSDGDALGLDDGIAVGLVDGKTVGPCEGLLDGLRDGSHVGDTVGKCDGDVEGSEVGSDGAIVGAAVLSQHGKNVMPSKAGQHMLCGSSSAQRG